MARVPRMTRTVMLNRSQGANINNAAAAQGGNQAQEQSQAARQSKQNAQQAGQIGAEFMAREEEKNNRYDTIQRARAVSDFQRTLDEDFTNFEAENDLTDPNAAKMFAETIRTKRAEFLQSHTGSEDSMARLDVQLTGLADQFSMRMSEAGRTAQREFITNTVGEHVNRITNEVYQNPSTIEAAFKQLNGLVVEYGGALDSVDEMAMLENAQSMIIEGAVNSFIDEGDYESARDLITQNDRFIAAMPPKQQMSLLGRVNKGIAAKDKERNELMNKMNAIESAAESAGVTISKTQLFSAATGIKETQTPEQKVATFQSVAGLSDAQMTPEIVAKIGFGVDLDIKDGRASTEDIAKFIKTPFENAASTKVQVDKVLLQSKEFLNTNNKQAGLAAMIAFQKLIDDGAAVREGDIKLSAQGNSSFDNIKLILEGITEGAIATPKQIEEMQRSAEIFGQSVLESSKTFIDPYLTDAQERGIRLMDIGLPQQAYNDVFGNTKTKEDSNKRNKEIEDKAAAHGMSVMEYMNAGAKKHNISAEDVAKKLGYTGKLTNE